MSDFVLRGICQHGSLFVYHVPNMQWRIVLDVNLISPCNGECEINGLLSAKQMEIVAKSSEFWDSFQSGPHGNTTDHFPYFLERNPFLVSEILRKAGEKEESEKQ